MTYQQIIQRLQPAYGIGEARAIARMMLEERFGLSLTDIMLGKVTELSSENLAELEKIIIRLEKNEPIQYILGSEYFCGHKFHVAPGVLIPRPETEELVQKVLGEVLGDRCWVLADSSDASDILHCETNSQHLTPNTHHPSPNTHHLTPTTQQVLADSSDACDILHCETNTQHPTPTTHHPNFRILDIGTGSGCIAISIALALQEADTDCEVEAWDISTDALAIARRNAEQLGANVTFRQVDVLAPHSSFFTLHSSFDIIVSNPPYICRREAAAMERNVLDYEPDTALFVPDDDPLLFYRAIARLGTTMLTERGRLYFEINQAYGPDTCRVVEELGYHDVRLIKDQFNNYRIVTALWQKK